MVFLPPQQPDIERLAEDSDNRLLQAIVWDTSHVVKGLVLPVTLSFRPYDFVIPTKDERNFILLVLYKKVPR